MELRKELLDVYLQIGNEIEIINSFSLEEQKGETYRMIVIGAIVKCFEYNLDFASLEDFKNSFYYITFLRGICEDLISLKFILKMPQDKRDEIIKLYSNYLQYTSIDAQDKFISRVNPNQVFLRMKDTKGEMVNFEESLKTFWVSEGYNKNKIFPSVEHMAIDGKLKQLYEFLYHATSKTVHFSPNVLLRMGWSYDKDQPIKFSTHNFTMYYAHFNMYYGTYLFITFINTFKAEFNFSKELRKLAKKLQNILKEFKLYPEIVTFEEMNMRSYRLPEEVIEQLNRFEKIFINLDKEKQKEFLKLFDKHFSIK